MDEYATLNHTTWDRKYHVVFIPKYRRKLLFQELRKPLGEFRQLAAQKESKVEERHLLPDRSHASVDPTKIRGVERSRVHQGKERDPSGADLQRKKAQFRGTKLLGARLFCQHGWTRQKAIREYIQNQEKEDQRLEQLNLWK